MPSSTILAEAYSFTPSALIELFELDGTAIGLDTVYRFVNGSSAGYRPITFGGVSYTPFPISVSDMDMDGKGAQSRPKLTVSNIRGFVSNLLLANGSSIDGATVTRTRVHARFLDSSNWPAGAVPPWVTPDPNASYAPEPWSILRKIAENPQVVSWELASPVESQGVKLPRRIMLANTCADFKYRDTRTCNYTGVPVADKANRTFTGSFYAMTLNDRGAYDGGATYQRGDYVYTTSTLPQFSDIKILWVCATNGTTGITPANSVSNWIADSCAKTSAACKLRFTDVPLRISAFPGISRAGFLARS